MVNYKPFKVSLEEQAIGRLQFIQRAKLPHASFEELYRRGDVDYKEIEQAQKLVVWRIVRCHALAKSQITASEELSMLANPELWHHPVPDASAANRSNLVETLCHIWERLPLLPDRLTDTVDYTDALLKTAKILRFDDHPLGPDLLYGLDHADMIQEVFPDREEIIHFEERFLAGIAAYYLKHGYSGTVTKLIDSYHLTTAESEAMVEMSKAKAAARIETNPVDDQKLMIARLEGYISRAIDSGDARSEIQGLKQLALVQGLGKIEPKDEISEFIDIIKAAHQRDKNVGVSGTDGSGSNNAISGPDDGRSVDQDGASDWRDGALDSPYDIVHEEQDGDKN